MTEHQTGAQVTSSLRLVRRLGAGGMGTVWIARHEGLRTDVVVKFITGELAKNADAVARFQREAAAASEVRSPHVVQIFDHGVSDGGLPYIAMELLEGENLGERIAREQWMPPNEVAGVVQQVARALSRAHDRKIVHRDIKPENIFLCDTGEEDAFVKVLDFGIAKVTGADQLGGTQTGAMIGSPYWMSPEQITGSKAIDHRTDVWSLGVVAFYMLTGRRPFEAETLGGLAVAICGGSPPVPSRVNPLLPPAVDTWFARACAVDVSARFPSVRAMADALVSAVGGARMPCARPNPSSASEAAPSPTFGTEASSPAVPRANTELMASDVPKPLASTTTSPASVERAELAAGSIGTPARSRVGVLIAVGIAALGAIGVGGLTLVRSSTPRPAAPTKSVESSPTHEASAPSAVPEALAPPSTVPASTAVTPPQASASFSANAKPNAKPTTSAAAKPSVAAAEAPTASAVKLVPAPTTKKATPQDEPLY